MIPEENLADLAIIFKAMGELSRLRLLRCLMMTPEQSVGNLAQVTQLSQANVSKHLKHLAQANLVASRRDGNSILYHISNPIVEDICSSCCDQIEREENEALKRLMEKHRNS